MVVQGRRGGGTEATFDMDYELPVGIAGRMVSRAAEPIVRGNIEQSVRNLRSQVERASKAKKPVKPGDGAQALRAATRSGRAGAGSPIRR